MGYKRLFIFVEGEDDARFFGKTIKPRMQKKYDLVQIINHCARSKREKINNFIRSIKAMNAAYIYIRDINNAPCVTAKKQEIQSKLRNIDVNRIIVVIKEIESWYLAGLSEEKSRRLGIHIFKKTTDHISKEDFNGLIPKKFDSRIDFMVEVLKFFSIKTAKEKNKSFEYFAKNYLEAV